MNLKKKTTTVGETVSISYAHGEADFSDLVHVVRCKDCKHNPRFEWFGCPMSHLSEKQRPDTAWCWRGEK